MSANAWSHAALEIRQRESAVLYCQHLAREGSPLYDAAAHGRALDAYRQALLGVLYAVQEQLALLPEPEVMPEKAAGHVSESLHG